MTERVKNLGKKRKDEIKMVKNYRGEGRREREVLHEGKKKVSDKKEYMNV